MIDQIGKVVAGYSKRESGRGIFGVKFWEGSGILGEE